MRISVHSRCTKCGTEPGRFCLGQAQLRVVSIVERRDTADSRYFEVRVPDGRDFLLCHQTQTDVWQLAAVYGRRPRRPTPPPRIRELSLNRERIKRAIADLMIKTKRRVCAALPRHRSDAVPAA
jgi:hypothetical protein